MEITDEDEIVKLDCEIIKRCDFVVLLRGWERSKGCVVEVRYCADINKMRYYSVEQIIFWGI